MTGLTVKIGADTRGLEQGTRSAIETAKRGAVSIAVPYIANSALVSQSFSKMGVEVGSSLGKIGAGARDATGEFSKLEGSASSLPAPIRGVLDAMLAWQAGVTVVQALNRQLEDSAVRMARLNAIADSARQTGVGTTFYQGVIAGAKEAGLEAEKAASILERAREAATVRIGEGKDARNESLFQARLRQNELAGNLTAADAAPYNAAQNQEDRIRAVLDLIEKLKAEQKALAANDLGKTFFGPDFERQVNAGIDVVGVLRRAMDGLNVAGGVILSTPEEIARQKDMQAQMQAIENTIVNAIKPAVEDFNYLSDVGKQTWIDWQKEVAGWVEWLGKGYLVVRDLAKQIRDMAVNWGLIGAPSTASDGGDNPLVVKVKPRASGPDRSKPLPSLSSAKSSRSEAPDPDSVRSVIQGLEKARDLAEAELKTVGLIGVERERALGIAKAEAAARADVEKGNRSDAALTAEELARINAAAEATGRFKTQLMDLEQQLKSNADVARYFGNSLSDAFADAVLEGKNLSDILRSLEKQLGRAALQAIFSGQGPLASLLGTAPAASAGPNAVGGLAGMFSSGLGNLFGGSKAAASPGIIGPDGALWLAEGGRVRGPGTTTSDSIPARLSDREFVVNAAATEQHLPLIEAINNGASPAEVERIILRDREAPAAVPETSTPQAASGTRLVPVMLSNREFVVGSEPFRQHATILQAINGGATREQLRELVTRDSRDRSVISTASTSSHASTTTREHVRMLATGGPVARTAPIVPRIALKVPALAQGDPVRFAETLAAAEREQAEAPARAHAASMSGFTSATRDMQGGSGGKPELHIHAADRTEVQQSQGPQGIRTDVFLDKKVAAALTGGPNTRNALKQISGARLVGK